MGLCFWPLISWLALPLACWTSFAWAMGGSVNKAWRRIGCSVVPAIVVSILTHKLAYMLAIVPAYLVLSIGYGIPDKTDPGSVLGRFWFKVFNGHEWQASQATRGTIYVLLFLSFAIPFWIIK